jgi:hypothetical protein
MTSRVSGVELICLGGADASVTRWMPFVRGICDVAKPLGKRICVLAPQEQHQMLGFYAPDVELRPLFSDMLRPDPSPTSMRIAFEDLIDPQPRCAIVVDGGAGYLISHVMATFRQSSVLHVTLEDMDGGSLATHGSPRSMRADARANFLAVANAAGFPLHPVHILHAPFTPEFHHRAVLRIIERFGLVAAKYCLMHFDQSQFATDNGCATVAATIAKLASENVNCVAIVDSNTKDDVARLSAAGASLISVFVSDLDASELAVLVRGSTAVITNRPALAYLAAHLDHPCLSLWAGLAWRRGLPEVARGAAVGVELPTAPDGAMATCVLSAEAVLAAMAAMTPEARTLTVFEDQKVEKATIMECLAAFAKAAQRGFTGGWSIASSTAAGAAPPGTGKAN